MATIEGGERLKEYLADLSKKVSRAGAVKIGFFEGRSYPDKNSTPVALVAAIQNFGAPSKGIPPRPFMSNAVRNNSDSWGPMLGKILPAVDFDASVALGQMGEVIAGEIRKSVDETNDPPLAKATIAAKGFSKPLIDSGLLRRSIEYKVGQ